LVYTRHIAIDTILKKLDKLIDSFVEVYIGKYGRPLLRGNNAQLNLKNLSEPAVLPYIKKAVQHLLGPLTKSLHKQDADLLTLRDELIHHLNQLLYLCSLH